jgi:hypothetical protein
MALSMTFRGEGLVYQGSLVEFRGLAVIGMDDCECAPCALLEPWEAERRVRVLLADLTVLDHARHSSFARP